MDKKASAGYEEMQVIRLLDFAIQIGLFLALIVILKEAGITLIVSFFGFYFWLMFDHFDAFVAHFHFLLNACVPNQKETTEAQIV